MANKPLMISGFIVWVVATGMFLASLLTKYWKTFGTIHFNLFDACVGALCTPYGWDPTTTQRSIIVPRYLMLVAAFFVLLGLVIGMIGLCTRRNKCCMVTEGVLTIVGGITVLTACAAFTAFFVNNHMSFGYSFYFGWVAGAAYIVAGALHCAGSA
uniref:Claudin n=1 Tax=Ciona savignyi TaxID=51511 RepID=H2ZM74_CIOSA